MLQKSFILFILERIYALHFNILFVLPLNAALTNINIRYLDIETSRAWNFEMNITSLYQGSQIFLARSRVQKNERSENINNLLFELFILFSRD